MTRYAVLGTGALGGLYGGLLARAGHEVHFLFQSDYGYVLEHGLKVESPLGDFHLKQLNAHRSTKSMPQVDVAIVAWKSTANQALREALTHLLTESGCVLVLQNGWDVERDSADIVGNERVLGGCCFLCSNKVGPGHIRHLDYGRITFGEYHLALAGAITPRMLDIEKDFLSAGMDVVPTVDLRRSRWTKLMWNIPFNGLSVVLGAATDAIMRDEFSRDLARELMDEVRAIAMANGTEIASSVRDQLMLDTDRMVPYASSMLLDYQHQRPMEVEAIFGNTCRAASAVSTSAPRVAMLYSQLKFLNQRNLGRLA